MTQQNKTHTMVFTALMTAVLCIMGPLSLPIPISPVPISLTNLALYFICCLLGMKLGTVSYLLYLLLGFAGLPVFSGFTGGGAKLLGPTGGYLFGFIFMVLICGWCFEHTDNRIFQFAGMIAGTALCYLFGTAWLVFQTSVTFTQALLYAVVPFLPGDIIKLILALPLGFQISKRLQNAGLL
jgi:biotin transport system substrate-specific component